MHCKESFILVGTKRAQVPHRAMNVETGIPEPTFIYSITGF